MSATLSPVQAPPVEAPAERSVAAPAGPAVDAAERLVTAPAVETAERSPGINRHTLARRLLTIGVLAGCVVTVVLAVPALRPAAGEITAMDPGLVAAAIALEVASCLGYVAIFRRYFPALRTAAAHEVAWAEMGSGALLPGGGAGSLAVGGWLLHQDGMETNEIVWRSSALFFLTSATNVLALAGASTVLLLGVGAGPHDWLRAGLPLFACVVVTIAVLAAAPLARRLTAPRPRTAWLIGIAAGITAARDHLLRPDWRLLGAFGYLFFDIGVLWTTLAAVGPTPPIAPLIAAYLIGYLANSAPIPGGVGVLDAGLVGALALYGMPVIHAAAAVLVYHAIAFWIPTLGGTVGYLRLKRAPHPLHRVDGTPAARR